MVLPTSLRFLWRFHLGRSERSVKSSRSESLQTIERREKRIFRSPNRTGKERFFRKSAASDIEYAMFGWFAGLQLVL